MTSLRTARRGTIVAAALATAAAPSTAWAVGTAPDANTFGLLVLVVLLLAAGVGAWLSLRERRESRSG